MKKLKSNILLFSTAIIWGFAFVAQRMGADYVGTFTFIGIRFALGALTLIPVIMIFEHKDTVIETHNKKMKTTLFSGVIAGLLLFTASALQQAGIEITQSAGKAGFLTGLYTVIVPVLGIFLKRKTSINIWIGAVLAVCGMFLLCVNEKTGVGFGDLILITCAVFYAIHIHVIDRFGDKIYSIRFSCIQFAVCGVLGMILTGMLENVEPGAIKSAAIPILYAGILSSGVAYTCQIIGQKTSDPTYASIIFSTESVFSAIGGAIILHEVMTGRGYAGCALIFAGIIISQLNFGKNTREICEGIDCN